MKSFDLVPQLVLPLALALSACSKSSSPSTPAPAAPVASQEVAKGMIHGKAFTVGSATYRVTKDQNGNPIATVTLSANPAAGCDSVAAADNSVVFLTMPDKPGTYGFPTGNAVFSYVAGDGSFANDIAGDSSMTLISDDGQTLKGSVVASFSSDSSLNGTFAAKSCAPGAVAPPTGATPAPGAAIDVQASIKSLGNFWRSDDHATTPGHDGEVSITIEALSSQLSSYVTPGRVGFQIIAQCAYAAADGGHGDQTTSDENGGFLEVDSSGTVYDVCPGYFNNPTGSLSSGNLKVAIASCPTYDTPSQPDAIQFTLTSAKEGQLAISLGQSEKCSGKVTPRN